MAQKNKIQNSYNEKQNQVRRFDELIQQSEAALKKIEDNAGKLNDALNTALSEDEI